MALGSGSPRAFPWASLPRVSRSAIRAARDVRAAVGAPPEVAALARALGELTASDVSVEVRGAAPAGDPPAEGRVVHLRSADGAFTLALEPEPAFTSALLGRLLKRPPQLTDASALLDPRTSGALAAVAVETARRAGEGVLLRAASRVDGRPQLQLDCVVHMDRTPFSVTVWIGAALPAARVAPRLAALRALGELPLTLPLVAAVSSGSRGDIAALSAGDAWMPGNWLAGDTAGRSGPPAERVIARLALAAPNGERGVLVTHSEGGEFVVRGDVLALGYGDGADTPRAEPHGLPRARPTPGATMTDDAAKSAGGFRDDTLREIALDAPVVVRVEVASVTLSAREWADLSAGDVLATGVRLTPQVVLRVAGREVARGDLVDIDGEVGVTIRELVQGGG